MKKIFTCLSVLISIVLLQSCSKQSPDEMLASPRINTTNINATIKSNGTYQLALDNLENVVITQQASHFQISEAGPDSKTGLLVYRYQPSTGYIGSDEVLLSSSKKVVTANTGGCNNSSSSYHTSTVTSNISIKINVSGN
jgi:hypothetical protein